MPYQFPLPLSHPDAANTKSNRPVSELTALTNLLTEQWHLAIHAILHVLRTGSLMTPVYVRTITVGSTRLHQLARYLNFYCSSCQTKFGFKLIQ